MSQLRCDVLVVGAGPAGAATAAQLARSGRDVVLLERARHPRPKACAEYASPGIARELARLGVAAGAWRAAAVPLDGMDVVIGERRLPIRYADARGQRRAWGVDRQALDALLAAHAVAAGARLVDESTLSGLERAADGWRATVAGRAGTSQVRARVVVGADGARSRTARLLGVEREVRFPRRLGLIAHVANRSGLHDHGEMHVGQGGYVGLAPMPGGRLNVGMALRPNGSTSALQRFDAAIAGLPAVAVRLRDAERLTPIRGASPIGHRVASPAGDGWLLVGDAAGFVDPFTGEGIYRALRSARAAADAVAAGEARMAEAYRSGRRTAFASKDAVTWAVQALLAAPPLLRHAVARLAERPNDALLVGSVLGDCRRPSDALSPRFLAGVLWP